jgi:thiol-disulfide isomerase/thioredoxin
MRTMTEEKLLPIPTLRDVQDQCPSCGQYIEEMSVSYRGGFMRRKEGYELNTEAVEKLKSFASDFVIVAVFADWCGDARKAIPVLSLLEDEIGLEVRALGGMTKPQWKDRKPGVYWAIPPSPKEVETFEITSSPTIIIFKRESGEEVGRIKTKPRMTDTIEEELVKIIEDSL